MHLTWQGQPIDTVHALCDHMTWCDARVHIHHGLGVKLTKVVSPNKARKEGDDERKSPMMSSLHTKKVNVTKSISTPLSRNEANHTRIRVRSSNRLQLEVHVTRVAWIGRFGAHTNAWTSSPQRASSPLFRHEQDLWHDASNTLI